MGKRFINLEHKLCKELEQLEEKYRSGAEMSEGDLRRIELVTHSLKCLIKYVDAKCAEDTEELSRMGAEPHEMYQNENSYANSMYMNSGRDPIGRFTSRDMGPNNSGYMPYYPQGRRW